MQIINFIFLRLNWCQLKKTCCEVLASSLRSNLSKLRELDLSDNDLKDSGVDLLCVGLGDSQCKLEILRSVLLGTPQCIGEDMYFNPGNIALKHSIMLR